VQMILDFFFLWDPEPPAAWGGDSPALPLSEKRPMCLHILARPPGQRPSPSVPSLPRPSHHDHEPRRDCLT
jgi:hypothetical protein